MGVTEPIERERERERVTDERERFWLLIFFLNIRKSSEWIRKW